MKHQPFVLQQFTAAGWARHAGAQSKDEALDLCRTVADKGLWRVVESNSSRVICVARGGEVALRSHG